MDDLTTTFQEQLRELLDKQELIERKHAYLRAADVCDPDRMVAGFAEEVTASYVPGEPAMAGRETVREWYAQRLTDRRRQQPPRVELRVRVLRTRPGDHPLLHVLLAAFRRPPRDPGPAPVRALHRHVGALTAAPGSRRPWSTASPASSAATRCRGWASTSSGTERPSGSSPAQPSSLAMPVPTRAAIVGGSRSWNGSWWRPSRWRRRLCAMIAAILNRPNASNQARSSTSTPPAAL